MGLNVGNVPVEHVYVGSTPVTAVYVGAEKVWPASPTDDVVQIDLDSDLTREPEEDSANEGV